MYASVLNRSIVVFIAETNSIHWLMWRYIKRSAVVTLDVTLNCWVISVLARWFSKVTLFNLTMLMILTNLLQIIMVMMRTMALFTTKLNAIDSLSYDEAIDGAFDYEAGSLTEANVLENQVSHDMFSLYFCLFTKM